MPFLITTELQSLPLPERIGPLGSGLRRKDSIFHLNLGDHGKQLARAPKSWRHRLRKSGYERGQRFVGMVEIVGRDAVLFTNQLFFYTMLRSGTLPALGKWAG